MNLHLCKDARASPGYQTSWADNLQDAVVGRTVQLVRLIETPPTVFLSSSLVAFRRVAILAPPSHSKFLSYMTGWVTVISWQAAVASACFLGGAMIQGLMVLGMPDTYVPQRWHGTLLFYAILAFSLFINTCLARILPHIESMVFVIHVAGFFAILVPLVYFAPHGTAKDVFVTFINGGGWPSDGLSFMIGLVPSMFTFIGKTTWPISR